MDPQSNFSELAGEANTLQQAGGDVGAAPAALGYAGWTTPAVADEAHGLMVGGRGVANGTGERARGRGRLVPGGGGGSCRSREPGARELSLALPLMIRYAS
jgi:hypothetical protein